MKVAVIGSRGLTVNDLGKYLPEDTTEIVSGGAKGIDTCARDYALSHDLKLTEFLPEYSCLDELKAHYQRGGLGDVKVKKFLNNVVQAELAPIRERRKAWEQRIPEVYEILKKGSEEARKAASKTMQDVRHAMQIDYFAD